MLFVVMAEKAMMTSDPGVVCPYSTVKMSQHLNKAAEPFIILLTKSLKFQ